jgi:hypothetical protein
MQEASAYGKKNLLILFDFKSFLNYVFKLIVGIEYAFDAKKAPGKVNNKGSTPVRSLQAESQQRASLKMGNFLRVEDFLSRLGGSAGS